MMPRFLHSILLVLSYTATITASEIRGTRIPSDVRVIIPFKEYRFTHSVHIVLNVSHIKLSNPQIPIADLSQVGFFLTTRHSWPHIINKIQENEIQCSLNSNLGKPVFTFDKLESDHVDITFVVNDANLYALIFANCLPDLSVSMSVSSSMYNVDMKTGEPLDIAAGKKNLPTIFLFFFMVYVLLSILWIYVICSKVLSVFRIHFFMLAVVVLKALNLLCEMEDKSFIKRTGTAAHGWEVSFSIFSFLKGITLFTLMVLIGTGWSFIKPYLQDKEKMVLMIVIPLHVMVNVAQVVVIDESGSSGEDLYTWKKVFWLVDILCCCAVLFPIVWSIKNLREAAKSDDGKAAVNLMKLTLFRHYYVVVICYIYFTRVVVYWLETITSDQYKWTSVVAAETATLAFYIFTGYNFRPKTHNPYFVIDDEEEEAASETLKLEKEVEYL
ncbi:Lung seven transmembrane receptor [Heracleum sosnowskyi]|uniref:Lung seven transmembrane receptor n=1 Tax=Heracleum sosnowskyi TaxID=360622 RepID=A0AAD8JB62_9APIA|nr:Lung seven transmembrane receptor [Heracleum sosnowskyi]